MRLTHTALISLAALLMLTACQGTAYDDFVEPDEQLGSFDQAEALQAVVDELVTEDGPGLVLAARHGDQPQVIAAAGLASIEDGTPISGGDHFRIASLTKTFIGVLALRLQEEGLITLDDPAADYLPAEALDGVPNGQAVTLRQLLNMTSGIPDYLDDAYYEDVYADPTYSWQPLDMLTYVQGSSANFGPGEAYEYSNSNYILLHIALENAAGQPLGALLRQYVFDPLGLADTYLETYEAGPLVAASYEWDGEVYNNVSGIRDGLGMADGGIVSTVADLDAFLRGVADGDLLTEVSLEEFFTLAMDEGEGAYYGLGVEIYEQDGWWGHTGATTGFTGEMWIIPEEDITVVWLRNAYDELDASDAVEQAAELAAGW